MWQERLAPRFVPSIWGFDLAVICIWSMDIHAFVYCHPVSPPPRFSIAAWVRCGRFFFFLGVSAVTVEHEKAFRGSSQNGFSLLSCLTCLNTTTMMAYILNVRESRHRRRALFLRTDQIFHVSVADKQYIMNFTNGRGLSFRADPLVA